MNIINEYEGMKPAGTGRLAALDAFRGLAIMLMILVNTPGSYEHVYVQLEHSAWLGCTIADLAFPFFVFSAGAAGYFSCQRQGGEFTGPVGKKLLRRTAVLFFLGILYNMFPFYDVTLGFSTEGIVQWWAHVRVCGVLQRIALGYGLGMLLCLWLKDAWRIAGAAAALLAIHSLGFFLYAPAAPFVLQHNLSLAVDLIVPGEVHLYQGFGLPFDPEGFYGVLSTTAHVLCGYLAGRWASRQSLRQVSLRPLAVAGAAAVLAALLLNFAVPICKALWTASYVLLASGLAALLLAAAIYVWETGEHRAVFYPFRVFGMNAIFCYFAAAYINLSLSLPWFIIDDMPVYDWIYQQVFLPFFPPKAASLAFGICFLALCWGLAELLYRRRIFLKV